MFSLQEVLFRDKSILLPMPILNDSAFNTLVDVIQLVFVTFQLVLYFKQGKKFFLFCDVVVHNEFPDAGLSTETCKNLTHIKRR